ncbi:MAG TPA: hypothetical protein PLA71_00280 [Saccharofermentans sp.]|nr:hypothetical protein [Saccharofermentans sp.]
MANNTGYSNGTMTSRFPVIVQPELDFCSAYKTNGEIQENVDSDEVLLKG